MLRRLTKAQRLEVHDRYGGRCGYCGNPLGKSWCCDHVEPVMRGWNDAELARYGLKRGEHGPANWMPACARCNQWKASMSLELFRCEIRTQAARLLRDSPQYRLAHDFGVVKAVVSPRVRFHFEEVQLDRA